MENCASCGHSHTMHYGGLKDHCNMNGCTCLELKMTLGSGESKTPETDIPEPKPAKTIKPKAKKK